LDGTGLIANYHRRGVRFAAQEQLQEMRGAGIATLRLIVWHQRDPGGRNWGVISSAGGALTPQHRDNLVAYLADVREAEYERLTVSFAPMDANDPRQPGFDPSTEIENWNFLRSATRLVKESDQRSAAIDLMNEGAPGPAQPEVRHQLTSYLGRMYERYIREFGGEDVVVSAIASQSPPDTVVRLQALIDAVRVMGPPPRWFEVHPGYTAEGVLANLRAVDETLMSNGLGQPLVIGETAYNDPAVADAIMEFRRASSRPVLEVVEWPLTSDRPCKDMSESPPYRADAYLDAFRRVRRRNGQLRDARGPRAAAAPITARGRRVVGPRPHQRRSSRNPLLPEVS
jgi:hypothetical protein